MRWQLLRVFLMIFVCCLSATRGRPSDEQTITSQQSGRVEPLSVTSDPMKALTNTFPKTVEIKNHGRLLEFCPDGTCDGFVVSGCTPVATLKDFAYLYEYFFSDYTYLSEWRARQEAKAAAEQVLSKPEFLSCKRDTMKETARCVLVNLSRNGHVRLIFVRYDEGERNVVREDLTKHLAEKTPTPN